MYVYVGQRYVPSDNSGPLVCASSADRAYASVTYFRAARAAMVSFTFTKVDDNRIRQGLRDNENALRNNSPEVGEINVRANAFQIRGNPEVYFHWRT